MVDGGQQNSSFKQFFVILHIQAISPYDLLSQMANFIHYVLTLTISGIIGHPFIAPYAYKHQFVLKQ